MGKQSRQKKRLGHGDSSKPVASDKGKWTIGRIIWTLVIVVGSIGAAVSAFWVLYDFGPQIAVEPLPASERFDPTSIGRFKVTNEGKLAIYDVEFWCGRPWSKKPAGKKEWLALTEWVRPANRLRTVESGQQFTAPCPGAVFITTDDGTKAYIKPLYLVVSIRFRPALLWPWRVDSPFAFSSQPTDKDGIDWIPRSIVDEFRDSTPVVESYTTPEQSR